MSVDVAALTVAIKGDTAGLAAALAQAEASTRQFAANAVAATDEATAAQKNYDKAVTQTVTSTQKLGDETVKTIVTTKQHGEAVTQTSTTISKLGDNITKTTVAVKEGESAVQSLTSRWLAFANLGSLLNLPGAGIASQVGMVGQGLESAAGSSTKLSAALEAIGPAGMAMGVAAAAGVALVAAAIVDATTKAAAWQAQLVQIQNNTGMSDAQAAQLSASSLALAAATGASPQAIAVAQERAMNIVKSPVAAQAITQMATDSATSMGYDPVATTTMLAQVMHEYGFDQSSAATPQAQAADILGKANEIMGQLHIAVQQSGVEQGPFSDALARPLGVGANIGFSPADVMTTLATLTLHGFPDVANAGTQEQSMESRMLAPTPAMKAGLEKLATMSGDQSIAGAFDPGNLAANGLIGTINDLKAALEKTGLSAPDRDALVAQIMPAARGGQALQALIGTGNVDLNSIGQKTADVTAQNTLAVDALDKTLQTTVGQWNLLKEKIDTGLIGAGSGPNRAVGAVLGGVNGASDAVGAAGHALSPELSVVTGGAPQDYLPAMADQARGLIAAVRQAVLPGDGSPVHVVVDASGAAGDPAQIAADHAIGLSGPTGALPDPAAAARAAHAQSMADQARQATATASAVDAQVQQATLAHQDLTTKLAGVKSQYAGVIDPMQAKVNSAQQDYDEASLGAQVQTDQVHDQYDGPIKDAQAALTAFQAQHQRASAQFAQEAADAHAAHDATIHQLQQQIQLITDANKYERERVQLTDQIAQNQASIALAAAQGDPAKRAADAGAIAAARATGAVAADRDRVAQLTYQLSRTPNDARNHNRYVEGQAQLAEAKAQLDEDSQVNPAALGAATTQGAIAGSKAAADGAASAIATSQAQLAAIPLQQKLDAEQATLQAQLDTIQKQKDAEDAIYNKTLPGLQSALNTVKQQEQDALDKINAQLRAKQEIVDQVKADLIPQIDAQTAAEKLAVDQINAQLAQVGLVEQAWKDAKANVDAYNKALTDGGPEAALTVARQQWAAQVVAEAGQQGVDRPGQDGTAGGTGTISVVAGASSHVDAYHDAAAQVASKQIGQKIVDQCEQFVDDVFGVQDRTGRDTAMQAAATLTQQGKMQGGSAADAPIGARLYYADADAAGTPIAGPGHVAIKTAADTQVASDDNGVEARQISTWQQQAHQVYLGYYVDPTNGRGQAGGVLSGGGGAMPGGGTTVNITVADGAIRVEGATDANARQQARLIHDSLTQLARDVAATITPGAPRNVPGNVRA